MPAEQGSRLICPLCTYDLSGLSGVDGETGVPPRCPECGTLWQPSRIAPSRQAYPVLAGVLVAVPAAILAASLRLPDDADDRMGGCLVVLLLPCCGVAAGVLGRRQISLWTTLLSAAAGVAIAFLLCLAVGFLFNLFR